MAFGLNLNAGGDFLPILKFDARAGRLSRMDRDDNTGEQEPIDITDDFEAAIDFEHGETGWIWFQAGQAPDFVMVPIGEPLPPQPSKNHKQGVRLRFLLSSKAAGGKERLRELATTAKTALDGLSSASRAWEAGREANPGKVVVARLAGVRPVLSGGGGQKSTNYEPIFEIVKWVKTPAEFAEPPTRAASPTAPQPATATDG